MGSSLLLLSLILAEDVSDYVASVAAGKSLNLTVKSLRVAKNGAVTADMKLTYDREMAGFLLRHCAPESITVPNWGLPWAVQNSTEVTARGIPKDFQIEDPFVFSGQTVARELTLESGSELTGTINLSYHFSERFRQCLRNSKAKHKMHVTLKGHVTFEAESDAHRLKQAGQYIRRAFPLNGVSSRWPRRIESFGYTGNLRTFHFNSRSVKADYAE